ncbi:hypothetical protein COT64_01780 [Candidatus Shapirobacteria bacterium CG09_land_8_20_14_0_10_39_12]|uniref:DUF6922 domain-containing protein n=1 Tax=Candidatus Shapirobacteria bacterium CG09_land_8_20_14_0_10_39_12 TaxID=1974885 RepID=A0A2H0WPL6_9BACT|nr:MAG: hypothetical protein COT64_01780 [Candidatus Shapirobacteria bacterium CG09_land_8_20_14_0_10_39_12]
MGLPEFLQSCFPSYDLNSLDKRKDKKLIITQVLNYGTEKETEWLWENYSKKEVEEVIRFPTSGMWTQSVLLYWLKIFDVKLDQNNFNKAVINLNSI